MSRKDSPAKQAPDQPAAATEETTDILSRSLRIIQYRAGHRAGSDDIFLAWAARRARPDASRILDLGSGKGTVALLLLRLLPNAKVIGIEAHPAHHDLAVRNAALNGLSNGYDARLGDFRDPALLEGEPPFDLICGAPPFLPIGTGVMPQDPGRAVGRFELRGGVEDYALTAARHLARAGRTVLLMNGEGLSRAESAVSAAGLVPSRLIAVRPRPGLPPTYWVIESVAGNPGPLVQEELCMRLATGTEWSPDYAAVRELLDLPPQP